MPLLMKHIVLFSGGIGSWAAAKRVAEQHGTDDLVLLFTDTKTEDEDLYRFIHEAAANVGGEFVAIADGRDIWEVFRDERFLGNTRADPCSKILKRNLARDWIVANCDPLETIIYLGIDWTEAHRADRAKEAWGVWKILAPMIEPPYLSKQEMLGELDREGIAQPRLYQLGFPHNNCGGFCVKAGQAHFQLLLERLPQRYRYHEQKEQELREYLDKPIAILRDRRGGETRPMTMREFREQIEMGAIQHSLGWGGCGCMLDD